LTSFDSVGIVIIAVISLLVGGQFKHTYAINEPYLQISFCGYKVLNWYERLAWLPVLIVFVVALGVGGKHLANPPPAEPATASTILSFASTIAGFVITYSPLSSDFTSYFQPDVSRCVV
jgi:purine-cytosine permease-like protein